MCNFSYFIQPENYMKDHNFDNNNYAEKCHAIHIENVHNDTKYYKSLALMLHMVYMAFLCC